MSGDLGKQGLCISHILELHCWCRYVGYALTTQWEGQEAAKLQMIGFDMGGTSTDVSRFAGSYEHVFESTTAGMQLISILHQRSPYKLCTLHSGKLSVIVPSCKGCPAEH